MNENVYLGDDINPVLDEVNASAEKHRKRSISAVCRRIYEQLQQNNVSWDEFVAEVQNIDAEPTTREKLVKFRADRAEAAKEVVALQPQEVPENVAGSTKRVNRKVKFSRGTRTDTPELDGESGIEANGRTDNEAEGQEAGEE